MLITVKTFEVLKTLPRLFSALNVTATSLKEDSQKQNSSSNWRIKVIKMKRHTSSSEYSTRIPYFLAANKSISTNCETIVLVIKKTTKVIKIKLRLGFIRLTNEERGLCIRLISYSI